MVLLPLTFQEGHLPAPQPPRFERRHRAAPGRLLGRRPGRRAARRRRGGGGAERRARARLRGGAVGQRVLCGLERRVSGGRGFEAWILLTSFVGGVLEKIEKI